MIFPQNALHSICSGHFAGKSCQELRQNRNVAKSISNCPRTGSNWQLSHHTREDDFDSADASPRYHARLLDAYRGGKELTGMVGDTEH
jgi:hypothetical protein